VFVDIDDELALKRAKERDFIVRNIKPEQWEKKIKIYYEGYKTYMALYREKADIILPSGMTV
jgi:uridine kinase